MTGWRLGYGVMPEWLVEAVNKLMVNLIHVPRVSRNAPIAALTGPRDWVDSMVGEFRRRREIIVEAEPDSGIPFARCRAGVYAFANVTGTGWVPGIGGLPAEAGGRAQRRVLRRIWRWLHPVQLR
jgi:aspartate/methionine/tyrosine aminotransferase